MSDQNNEKVAYYPLNDGSVVVVKKPREEVSSTRLSTLPLDSDIVELTETDTKNRYRATFRHNDYRKSRRSKTPSQKKSYAGVVEERRNYKFYASGTGTVPGVDEEEVVETSYRERAVPPQVVEITDTYPCCNCHRCPYCNKIKRERYVEYDRGVCPYCMGRRVDTTCTSHYRAAPPQRRVKKYKIIEAVPVRLTEYEGEVEEDDIDDGELVEYYPDEEKEVFVDSGLRCNRCSRFVECPYYQGRNVRNIVTTTPTYDDGYCPRCSCGLHSRNIITTTKHQPEYLDNYRFHEIRGTSAGKRSKSANNKY